jgi:GT2 family glycosyltransferase
MSGKIGVGVITKDREDFFWKCWKSLELCSNHIDEYVVVNDGNPYAVTPTIYSNTVDLIQHTDNTGVAISKNQALQHLLDKGCDHIFLIEDDMFIKDSSVFQKYIEASEKSGIQHFNFSQHGFANKIRNNMGEITPNPKITIKYGDNGISFYQHCVGSFSYYSRKCLDDVGLMDERYYNACEHVDHTYEIIKKGYHPPFWWFADIENSWEYIGDDGWSIETSSISSSDSFMKNVKKADEVFVKKHGHFPIQTPSVELDEFGKSLKEIKKKWKI